jgi:hypothetical protein
MAVMGASAKQNTLPAYPVPSFGSRLGHSFFECWPIGFYTVSRIYLGATSIRNIIMWLSGQPLAQFLLLGTAIFALYKMVARPETVPTEIRVDSTELRWLQNVWQRQFGRRPSIDEMRVAVKVYEHKCPSSDDGQITRSMFVKLLVCLASSEVVSEQDRLSSRHE